MCSRQIASIQNGGGSVVAHWVPSMGILRALHLYLSVYQSYRLIFNPNTLSLVLLHEPIPFRFHLSC